MNEEEGSDYINANYIPVSELDANQPKKWWYAILVWQMLQGLLANDQTFQWVTGSHLHKSPYIPSCCSFTKEIETRMEDLPHEHISLVCIGLTIWAMGFVILK